MKQATVNIVIKRMIKVIKFINKVEFPCKKRIEVVRKFAELENINIQVGKKTCCRWAVEQYNNPNSSVFKGKKLPVVKRKKKFTGVKTIIDRKKAYNAYLLSSKWLTLRNKIKNERGNKCEICSITGVELHGHHLTYERFGNELETDIQILCKKCHFNIHNKKNKKVKKPIKNVLLRRL